MPVVALALALPLVLAAPDFDEEAALTRYQELDAEPQPDQGAMLLDVGATYRRIYDIPVYGMEFELCGGHWTERGGDFLCGQGFVGRTAAGLTSGGVALRYRADFAIGPLFLGVAPGIGGLWFKRKTKPGSIGGGGLVLAVLGGARVFHSYASALDVELWLNADLYPQPVWGPSLRAAYRF